MDRVQTPCELGFMIITEDGRLADSGGDLKNQDRLSKMFYQIKIALETSSSVLGDTVHSITIQYDDHLYILAFEPRRSLVVKRKVCLTEA